MMKSILVVTLISIFTSFQEKRNSYCPVDQITFDLFCKEMQFFIKNVKDESVHHGKHNVYLAKFTEADGYGFCVTMEYVFTKQDTAKLEMFNYFTLIDSSLVVISIDEHLMNKYDFRDSRMTQITNLSVIINRLYDRVFFGDGSASVSCFSEEGITRENYQNDSYVPDGKRIFEFKHDGIIRRVDGTEFQKKRRKQQ